MPSQLCSIFWLLCGSVSSMCPHPNSLLEMPNKKCHILKIYNTVMFDTAQLAWANLCIHERFLSGLCDNSILFSILPISNFNFLKPIWLIRMEIVQQLSPVLCPYDMLIELGGSRVGIRSERVEFEFCGYLRKLSLLRGCFKRVRWREKLNWKETV